MVYKPTSKLKVWVDSVPVYGGMALGNAGVGSAFVSSEGDPLFWGILCLME